MITSDSASAKSELKVDEQLIKELGVPHMSYNQQRMFGESLLELCVNETLGVDHDKFMKEPKLSTFIADSKRSVPIYKHTGI